MSEEKQVGYVVFYDTNGGGLTEPSWGIHVCWGEGELQDEVSRVFNEIEPEGFTLDDIVILRIDESFNLKVKRETRMIDETMVELERKP
jgi:hypothetical protein